MGRRSGTKTLAEVIFAFTKRRTWAQADLARTVGVSTEALRTVMRDLRDGGFAFVDEKDPPHVYWKAPRNWFPGAVAFKGEDVTELLRLLARMPRGKSRDRLLELVLEQLPARGKLVAKPPVVARGGSDHEEQWIRVVEDAAARKVPLFMRYFTASKGKPSERRASVHLVDVGPPVRFIATCHRNGDLRWFRVEGIIHARPDEGEPFRDRSHEEVAAFRAASLDGFKGPGAAVACSFFVREPECNWVANNLLDGMRVDETLHDGIRFSIETSALQRLARFVVGLGDAARPETPDLAMAVAELAHGALGQAQSALQEREIPEVSARSARRPAQPRSDV